MTQRSLKVKGLVLAVSTRFSDINSLENSLRSDLFMFSSVSRRGQGSFNFFCLELKTYIFVACYKNVVKLTICLVLILDIMSMK